MQTTWENIYSDTGIKVKIVDIYNQQNIADVFNNCFLTIADNITNKNINNTTVHNTISINNDTFMPIMLQAFTTKYS